MRNPLTLAAVAAAAISTVSSVAAQDTGCGPEATIRTCVESRYSARIPGDPKAETASKPAGEANAGNLQPTIDDFIPRLSAALLAPGLDTALAIRLTTNQSLNRPSFNYLPWSARLGVELSRPQVYAPILDSIAEARRTGVRERLSKEFTEIDDPEFTLGFNRENRSTGRLYESHIDELAGVLATLRQGDQIEQRVFELMRSLNNSDLKKDGVCPTTITETVRLGCLTDEARATVVVKLHALADALVAYTTTRYPQWVEQSGWKYVPDLINNQPQLNLHATYRPRPRQVENALSAAGPASWSIRGRWERGSVNMNEVRNHCRRRNMNLGGGAPTPGYSDATGFAPDCFAQYLSSEDVRQRLRRGARAFVQMELARENHYEAPFVEADSAHFALPDLWLISTSIGYGRYLGTGDAIQNTRIDVGGEMQWAERDDPLRPSRRGLISVTLTQRLNQNFSMLSGLAWSPTGEFKDDNVQKVRFNLGVRYKLVPALKNPSGS